MTLVLSCATPDCVFQVSDRRLTWLTDPKAGTVADDEANKAVIVGHRMAFGYTGLATIGAEPTDLWLTKVSADGPTDDLKVGCDRICERATDAFKTQKIDGRFRHAFIGVGWVGRASDPTLQPTLCTISNAIGADGGWLDTCAPEFTLQVNNWGRTGAGFGIAATGQPLRNQEKYAIWRLIRRCVKKHAGPGAILRALMMAMDFTANRYATIGRSFMALSMPRAATERYRETGKATFFSGAPEPDENTFLYSKPNGGVIAYGPHLAVQGMTATGLRVTRVPKKQ